MYNYFFKFFHYALAFIIVLLIGNFLLYLSCSFDSKKLYKNVKSSYDIIHNQGTTYSIIPELYITTNNYTDSLIVNEMYSVDKDNPFESYMKMRKNYKKGFTVSQLEDVNGEGKSVTHDKQLGDIFSEKFDTVKELGEFLDNDIHTSVNYGRYWHGYTILYRPLLLFLNITQIRYLLFLVFYILLIYFLNLVYKEYGKSITLIYAMSLICTGYISVAYSLESSPIFLVMIISSIILLKNIDRIKNFGTYIFIVACIANFVDYLTVPLITLCVPMSLYILKMFKENKDWKECIKFIIINSIIWFLGYALTWVSKWILYDLFFSSNTSMVEGGFVQSFYRTKRYNYISENVSYFEIILKILKRPGILFGIPISILSMICINKFKIQFKFNKNVIPFILIALFPIMWYIVLANHTLIHFHFTYRHCLIYMLGLLLAINELFFNHKCDNNDL